MTKKQRISYPIRKKHFQQTIETRLYYTILYYTIDHFLNMFGQISRTNLHQG